MKARKEVRHLRNLKERERVRSVIWFTYCTGYEFGDGTEPLPFKDVIRARVGVAAAQNFLRHARGDKRLVVTSVETERTVWDCDIDSFMSVANNVSGKTIDAKETD